HANVINAAELQCPITSGDDQITFLAGGRTSGGADTSAIIRVVNPRLTDWRGAWKIGTLPVDMVGGTLQRHPTDAASLVLCGGLVAGVASKKVYKISAANEGMLFTGVSASTLTVTEIGSDQLTAGLAYAGGIYPEAGGLAGMPTFSEAAARRAVLVGGITIAGREDEPYSLNGSLTADQAEFTGGNEGFHRLYYGGMYGGSPIFEYGGHLYQFFGNQDGDTPVRAQRVAL